MARQLPIKSHDLQAGITSLPAAPGAGAGLVTPEGVPHERVEPHPGRARAAAKARRHGKGRVPRADEDDAGTSGANGGADVVLEDQDPRTGYQRTGLHDDGTFPRHPTAGEEEGRLIALNDADAVGEAVGDSMGDVVGGAAAAAPSSAPVGLPMATTGGFSLSPAMLGGIGLATVAVGAAAAGGGGTAPPPPAPPPPPQPPATPTQAPVAYRDDVGTLRGEASSAAVTDDATPGLLVGALPSNASGAVLYVDGVVTASVYDPATGTLTPAAPLKDGAHALGYGWSNEGGVTPSSPTLGVVVDTVPPMAPDELRIVDIGGNGRPTISGRGEPGGVVTILDPTGTSHVATIDPSGHFALEIAMPATAIGVWKAFVTDAAGNAGTPSILRLTDDPATSPPVVTKAIDAAGDLKGEFSNHGYTDDRQPLFKGTSSPRAQVAIFEGGTLLATVQADKSGLWEYQPAKAFEDGAHTLTLRATDSAGNVSRLSDAFVFTVDTVLPTAPDIAGLLDDVAAIQGRIVDGGVTNDARPTLSGWTKPGATVRINDQGVALGAAVADATGYWSFTPAQQLSEGAHQWTATVVDQVGRTSSPTAPIRFVVDATAPTIGTVITSVNDAQGADQGPVTSGTITDDAQPLVAGTAEPGTTVTLWDGAREVARTTVDATGNWSVRPTLPLASGSHRLTATATDAAGNTGPASDPAVFTVLTGGAPTVNDNFGASRGTLAAGAPTDDTRPTVSGHATPGGLVQLYDGTQLVGSVTADAVTGAWSIRPKLGLAVGPHELTATVTPVGGAQSDASGSFTLTVDTTAPALPALTGVVDHVGSRQGPVASGDPMDDRAPTLRGTAEAGSIVTVLDAGEAIGSVVADATGVWEFTPLSPLNHGTHAITLTATDAAGNVSKPRRRPGWW